MVKMKYILLALAFASAMLPARAMDNGGDDGKGFFGKVGDFAKDHPIITVSVALCTAGGVALFRLLRQMSNDEQLLNAAGAGDLAAVQRLVGRGANVNMEVGWRQNGTPLFSAIASGNEQVVKLLLDNGSHETSLNHWDFVSLHEAATRGHAGVVKVLLCHVKLPTGKTVSRDSYKRVLTTLCVFNKTDLPKLPKDIQLTIFAYLPEDVISKEHCRLIANKGANIGILINICPQWLQEIYEAYDEEHKEAFLERIVSVLVEPKLQKISQDIAQAQYDVNGPAANPAIVALLDPTHVERHRDEVEKNVRAAFLATK